MSAVRHRIVSDLHVGESHSRVAAVAALAPLLEGCERLVLNGDTIETLYRDHDGAARRIEADFAAWTARHADRVTVLTGNHDPDVSPSHHIDLHDGRLLVTHGDIVFPDMTPWGWEREFFVPEFARRLAAEPPGQRRVFETRLRLCKAAILAIADRSPRINVPAHAPWRRWRVFGACLRAHRVLRAWRAMPAAAAALLAEFRPAARVLVFGHVHRPGVWRRDGRLIVNTGAAAWPLGGRVVDLHDEKLVVRDLVTVPGAARAGRVRAEFGLAETFARTGSRDSAMLPATTP